MYDLCQWYFFRGIITKLDPGSKGVLGFLLWGSGFTTVSKVHTEGKRCFSSLLQPTAHCFKFSDPLSPCSLPNPPDSAVTHCQRVSWVPLYMT